MLAESRSPETLVTRPPGRFEKFSRRWVLACAGILATIHATLGFTGDVQALLGNFIHTFTFGQLVLGNIFFIVALAFGVMQVRNRLGNLVLVGAFVGSGYFQVFIVQRFSSFTLAQAFWFGILLFVGFGIIFALRRMKSARAHPGQSASQREPLRQRIHKSITAHHHAGLAFFLAFLALGTMYGTISLGVWQVEIPIQPKDYQIQFRFWASYSPSYYTDSAQGQEILAQFNRHNVTIQNTLFTLRDADGNVESFAPTVYPDDVASCVSTLAWFRDNAPYVRFQFYAYGIGHASNGNYEGSIYSPSMVKRFVDICRNYSLPNVVGIYTDWEGPGWGGPIYANASLNGWHQALWNDAFAYVRTYFPNWTLSCCYMDYMHWDLSDGDDDLQYFERYNIFNPVWDDYAPMVYPNCDGDSQSTYAPGGSWRIYGQAYALLNGALGGNASKASMWVGCTGCGPYRPDAIVYEHGAPIAFGDSKGFAAFARDILILKHFGYASVSIFLAISQPNSSPPLWGFFDSYGAADALDKLNDMVNGPDSTQPFAIWTDGMWNPGAILMEDLQLSFNRLEYLPLMAGLLVVGGLAGFYDRVWHKLTHQKRKLQDGQKT